MTKVAFPTDDGRTISRYFGQAQLYVVVTIQSEGQAKLEQRDKYSHAHQAGHLHEHGPEGHGHTSMFASISDCQVLIAGGMGQPAFDSAVASGLQVIMTGETSIEAALNAYRAGTLVSDPRRVHAHHPD